MINTFNTAVIETASNILAKHRTTKKPWVTKNMLKLCGKRRELKQKKTVYVSAKQYKEVNLQIQRGMIVANETWIEQQCQEIFQAGFRTGRSTKK